MTLVYTGLTKAQQVEVQPFSRHQSGLFHTPPGSKRIRGDLMNKDLQDLLYCSRQDQSHGGSGPKVHTTLSNLYCLFI